VTTTIKAATKVHQGRFNVRVRDGRDWTRLELGSEPGEFELGDYGVMVHGKAGTWTLIPWSNILVVEPTT